MLVCSHRPKLRPEPKRLLQVVADDLLELRRVLSGMLVQPAREALMQRGAQLFRRPVVGGVADEDVAEAESVLAVEVRRVRPHQLLPD